MGSNTAPQFTGVGNINGCLVTAAHGSSVGSGTVGTNMFLAFTAGTNGSYVEMVIWQAVATANTTMTATTGRIYLSSKNSGTTTGGTDTFNIDEWSLPAVSADHSTAGVNAIPRPLGFRLPANWTILVDNNNAPAANTNWLATVIATDY